MHAWSYVRSRSLLVAFAGAAVVLFALAYGPQTGAQQEPRSSVDGATYRPFRAGREPQARALHPAADQLGSPSIVLPAVSVEELPVLRKPAPGVPLRVGVNRALSRVLVGTELEWADAAGGQVAVVSLTSPGARAMRVELGLAALPAGTELRFYAPDATETVMGPYSSEFLLEPVGRQARTVPTFWSPVIAGEVLSMEIWLPDTAQVGDLLLAIHQLAHLVVHPRDVNDRLAADPSGPCNRNIACDPKFLETAKSVAVVLFDTSGGSALCTGQLAANTRGNFKPYFLTAAHCISTRAEARTASFFWFFQRAACADTTDDIDPVQTAGGARLVDTTGPAGELGSPDTSLLKLRRKPPAGVTFAGWTIDNPVARRPSTRTQGIHHPSGDVKMGSIGESTRLVQIKPSGAVAFEPPFTHYEVVWRKGTTEGGSSGSGIWVGRRWPKQYLIGVLTGGFASCSDLTAPDYYGRFDTAFLGSAKMRKRLDPRGVIEDDVAGQFGGVRGPGQR